MKTIARISRENFAGAAVIVEGMNDKAALRRLGLKGKILSFKSSGQTLLDFVDGIGSKRVLVLTDFDKEGHEVAARITEELEHQGVKVEMSLRRQLAAMVKPEITKVEELPSFLLSIELELS